MTIISFKGSQIKPVFWKPGYFKLLEEVNLEIKTKNDGIFRYKFKPGFVTDMRSGSDAINSIIPKWSESNDYNLALLAHDFGYTRMTSGYCAVNKNTADELLGEMLRVSGTLGLIKRTAMLLALKLFGGSSYDGENIGVYEGIQNFMEFRWDAK